MSHTLRFSSLEKMNAPLRVPTITNVSPMPGLCVISHSTQLSDSGTVS